MLIHTLNTYTLHTHMNTYISISVTVVFIAPLHTYIYTYIHTILYLVVCNFNIYQLIHTYIYIHTYIHKSLRSHPNLSVVGKVRLLSVQFGVRTA